MRVSHTGNGPAQGSEKAETRNTEKASSAHGSRQVERGSGPHEAVRSSHSGANAEISPKSREFAQAKAVATSTPDTREDRIAELKKRISEGDYAVDPDEVASRMVDDHLRMSGIVGR